MAEEADLPRRLRLGLIEALRNQTATDLFGTFRGDCASASLKPGAASGGRTRQRPFRGDCASASLKHGIEVGRGGGRDGPSEAIAPRPH